MTGNVYAFRYPGAKGIRCNGAVAEANDKHGRVVFQPCEHIVQLLGERGAHLLKKVERAVTELGRVQRDVFADGLVQLFRRGSVGYLYPGDGHAFPFLSLLLHAFYVRVQFPGFQRQVSAYT